MSKTCSRCGAIKAAVEFSRRSRSKDGLAPWCKACMGEYRRKWQAENPEKVRAYSLAHYHRDPSKNREANRRWYQRNSGKNRAKAVMYKMAVAQRLPAWADICEVRAIYEECVARRKAGEDVVVDHIIPLRGAMVSGLHVASNLRIVPRELNSKKGNKFESWYE